MIASRCVTLAALLLVAIPGCQPDPRDPDPETVDTQAFEVFDEICGHDLCTTGPPRDRHCHPCVREVCRQNPSCCDFSWHQACVGLFSTVCQVNCPFCVGRDLCVTGPPMDPTCDNCIPFVCAADPFCCNVGWDFLCITEAVDICGACGCHDRCEVGDPLSPICGDCISAVCQVDPFCCNVAWDSLCVLGGEWACGSQCP